LKQARLIFALMGALLLAGCGGTSDHTSQSTFNNGSGNQPYKPTTHLSYRSLVTNYYAGYMIAVDTYLNKVTNFTFSVGTQPTTMQSSTDGTLTFINNTGSGTISSFNNNLEAVKGTVSLGGSTESFVTNNTNKIGFAAVPDYNNGNAPLLPGAIARFNPTDGSTTPFIPFPYVRYLSMDIQGKHLLAFTDQPEVNSAVSATAAYQAHWVDLTATDAQGLPLVTFLPLPVDTIGTAPTLSRPVAGFFSADGTKVYILNCGLECGGSSTIIGGTTFPAWITEVDVTTPGSATVLHQWGVPGAQAGYYDLATQSIYVAGSSGPVVDSAGNTVHDGHFTVVNLTNGPVYSLRIGNGSRRVIRKINESYWIGANNCGAQSCVTIVNPSATGTATVLPSAKGDATGMTLNTNSNQVYTIEGQELQIYDINGNPITSEYNTDVKGQAYDVMFIN
jgi:hypothetical protein